MNNIKIIVFPARELESTKQLFSTFLGVDPYVDQPYYVGYKVGDLEIGLDPHAQQAGPITYIDAADIKQSMQEVVALGATVLQEPKDVGGGLLVASVKDKEGNMLGFRQAA